MGKLGLSCLTETAFVERLRRYDSLTEGDV